MMQFQDWYERERMTNNSVLPAACCLSTIGLDGYPNARYVSLKAWQGGSFIVTGSTKSRKGKEILKNPKVALTFWWPSTQKQVRVQGNAGFIKTSDADKYFHDRSPDAKIVSQISEQGAILSSRKELETLFEVKKSEATKLIDRPAHWLGFRIHPYRIEFLAFQKSRLHHRELYSFEDPHWTFKLLQP